MTSKLNNLFDYVQERCLWQFASRTWDRTENIEGVLKQVGALLKKRQPVAETPAERLHLADAKVLVNDCRQRYDWVDVDPGGGSRSRPRGTEGSTAGRDDHALQKPRVEPLALLSPRANPGRAEMARPSLERLWRACPPLRAPCETHVRTHHVMRR